MVRRKQSRGLGGSRVHKWAIRGRCRRSVRFIRRHLKTSLSAYAVVAVALTALLFAFGGFSAERTGLNRRVYPEVGFNGAPLLEDISANVTLDFLDEDPELPRRFFSARWHGYWYVPEARTVDIYGAGDDRLDVWLDGELVIRRTPPADMHTQVQPLTLAAGVHEIRIEYEQHGGARALSLRWAARGGRPRPFASHRLFHARPTLDDLRLAQRVAWLELIVLLVWATPVVIGVAFLARRMWAARARGGPGSCDARYWETGGRVALVLGIAAVAIRATLARLPGWNPESLWSDDLVYGAIIRADFWSMVTVPIHVAPGLFVIWRWLYAIFPDPEWSLQILPFACGIAAIPVMALVVRTLTNDDGLALLAAALTALNPLLAHHTVFVHQYPFDFLVTGLFLLAATRLCRDESGIDPRQFRWVALSGGVATFFSVTSVFASFPVVNLGAAVAARDWVRHRRRTIRILQSATAYNAAVVAAYVFLRGRSNNLVREDFAAGFMPLDSASAAWGFLTENGRRLLELSLPSWGAGEIWNPTTVSWPVPFLGLGLVWLLVCRPTRFFGVVVVGFYTAFMAASALGVYPLGTGRPDIFAFPVGLCLFVVGIHLATEALPRAARVRLAAAMLITAVAVARPLHVEYWDVNDAHLVDSLMADLRPDDAVIVSPSGAALIAFYGRWPVTVTATNRSSNRTLVTIGRDRMQYLSKAQGALQVTPFLADVRPARAWYVAFRTADEAQVTGAIEGLGYAVHEVEESRRGSKLYLALAAP